MPGALGGTHGFLLAPDSHAALPDSPSPHSTISSILGAWLDQYSEDFRKPPDFTCLKQLISYVHHNIPGSDLERRARILLAQFQQQEQSESEAEGGLLSLLPRGRWGLQVERVLLAGTEGPGG